LRLTEKEKAVIRRRRKLWSRMGWYWAYERADGGRYKTKWTDNEHESKGVGYFRKNHSLSCKNHGSCRTMLQEKVAERRRQRRQSKKIIEKELQEI
jgi:hypothetical protein